MPLPHDTAPTIIDALLTGRVRPFTRPGSTSAIAKTPVDGPVRIDATGLDGDQQGDQRVHGGPDKAVHHYPRDHYDAWRRELGAIAVLDRPGAFGENLSGSGLTEASVCLGDRFGLGEAELEVSQSRQPCWKLNDRFGVPDMARRVQASGRTGWYYRVVRAGIARAGDALVLIERPWPQWPLARVIDLLYRNRHDRDAIAALLELPLVPSWRELLERRLRSGATEDWRKRLDGTRDPAG